MILAVAASTAFAACSSLRESVGGWFGGEPESGAARAGTEAGEPFYAAVQGLTVFAQPGSSATCRCTSA